MKNLNPIICNDIVEFDLIAQSKNQPTRGVVTGIRNAISLNFNNYLNNFQTIHTIAHIGFSNNENAHLLKCYTSTTKALRSLVSRINSAQTVEFQYICAYCQYHTVSTIDHYIPKDPYPAFCVMPRNLLPCCSNCNSIKNDFWRSPNERWFIHLYNDPIPNISFLQGTLSFNGTIPTITYSLVQPAGLNDNMFALITSHFTKLDLLDLYRRGIGTVIAEIKKSVAVARGMNPNLTQAEIVRAMQITSDNNKIAFGVNYWQSVAMDSLSQSPIFLQTI